MIAAFSQWAGPIAGACWLAILLLIGTTSPHHGGD